MGPGWVVSDKTSGNYGARTHDTLTDDEKFFVENSDRAATLAESSDPHADYSFDDYALAELDGTFYVFNTVGCSCPSPCEVWDLDKKGTREEIVEWLQPAGEAFNEFIREVAKVWPEVTAPEPRTNRWDY